MDQIMIYLDKYVMVNSKNVHPYVVVGVSYKCQLGQVVQVLSITERGVWKSLP